jgi:hypothetical protein
MDETERRPTDGGGEKAGPRLRARREVQREVLRKRYQSCGERRHPAGTVQERTLIPTVAKTKLQNWRDKRGGVIG